MLRSRNSASLELSEFFDNDDSDGHRLAEFLLKKKGDAKRPKYLFMSSQPQRTSLDVQFEKVQSSPAKEKETKKQKKNVDNETEEKEKENSQQNFHSVTNQSQRNEDVGKSNVEIAETQKQPTNNSIVEIPETQMLPLVNIQSPKKQLQPTTTTTSTNAITTSPSRRQSPLRSPVRVLGSRISATKKSGGVSPGDRLRRLSLKRLTKLGNNGRRTLLQEFEGTMNEGDFEPPVCSTPLSQIQTDISLSPPTTNNTLTNLAAPKGNVTPTPSTPIPKSSQTNKNVSDMSLADGSPGTSTLIKTLVQKDCELKELLENVETTMERLHAKNCNKYTIRDNTCMDIDEMDMTSPSSSPTIAHANLMTSPMKKTYTIKMGEEPGQVILTPEKTNLCPKSIRFSDVQLQSSSPQRVSSNVNISYARRLPRTRCLRPEIRYSSPKKQNTNAESFSTNCSHTSSVGISQRSKRLLEASRRRSSKPPILSENVLDNTAKNNTQDFNIPCTQEKVLNNNLEQPVQTNNCSIIYGTQEPDIPETQEQHQNSSITIQTNGPATMSSMVIVPINHFSPLKDTECFAARPKLARTPQKKSRDIVYKQMAQANICTPIKINSLHSHNMDLRTPKTPASPRNQPKYASPPLHAVNHSLHISVRSPKRSSCKPITEINVTTTASEQVTPKKVTPAAFCRIPGSSSSSSSAASPPQIQEDNLKLTDILTDDDDDGKNVDVPQTGTLISNASGKPDHEYSLQNDITNNNSQAPLNLAPTTIARTKRLRKRSLSRRRLQMNISTVVSTETETEPLPAHNQEHAQNLRRIDAGGNVNRRKVLKKRSNIPLNKAPGTPLNGELFAVELARMSNYEILDLRKRNSLGKIFSVNGRKSFKISEDSMKKQKQLNDEIEMELQRREKEQQQQQHLEELQEKLEQQQEQLEQLQEEQQEQLEKQQQHQEEQPRTQNRTIRKSVYNLGVDNKTANDITVIGTLTEEINSDMFPPVPDEFRDSVNLLQSPNDPELTRHQVEIVRDEHMLDEHIQEEHMVVEEAEASANHEQPAMLIDDQQEVDKHQQAVSVEEYQLSQEKETTESEHINSNEQDHNAVQQTMKDTERRSYRESSFIDEDESDRILFINPSTVTTVKNVKKSKQRKREGQTPEILKQYLNISKQIKSKTKHKKSRDISKRQLYSHGNSDSELNSSLESQSGKYAVIPSPPKIKNLSSLKVVSPPPTFSSENNKETENVVIEEAIIEDVITENVIIEENRSTSSLLAPPPQFDTDSGISSTSKSISMAGASNNDDNHVFKKPFTPKQVKKSSKKREKPPKQQTKQAEITELEESGSSSLRRSKRAHVPTANPANLLFQQLYTQVYQKRLKDFNRLHELKKMQLKHSSKATIGDSSSIAETPIRLEKRGRKKKPELTVLSEEADLISTASSSPERTNKQPNDQRQQKKSQTQKEHKTSSKSKIGGSRGRKKNTQLPVLSEDAELISTTSSSTESTAKSSKNSKKPTDQQNQQKESQNQLAITEVSEDQLLLKSLERDIEILSNNNKKDKEKGKENKIKKKKKRKEQKMERSHLQLNNPPPVDHFNNIFDLLKSASTLEDNDDDDDQSNNNAEQNDAIPTTTTAESITSTTAKSFNVNPNAKCRKLIVRIKKDKSLLTTTTTTTMTTTTTTATTTTPSKNSAKNSSRATHNNVATTKPTEAISSSSALSSYHSSNASYVSSSAVNCTNSNFELISWLKNLSETKPDEGNVEILKQMKISSRANLCFSELQGVEYAFYDTDEKASLGYLRFKPHQLKPRKKTKRFQLNFVTLFGNFRFAVNDKESIIGPGDMVAIEKSVYYDIENITEDYGILMVIKK